MKEEINKMLNNIVGEDLAKKIFEANFPEPIINYASGDILTFKEIKELPEGTVIYLHYVDDFQLLNYQSHSTIKAELSN